MTLGDASLVLRLPRGPDGPILTDLVGYRDERLAEATDEEQRDRIWRAFHVAANAQAQADRRSRR